MRLRSPRPLARLQRRLRGRRGEGNFFAWLPVRLSNGTWVWLERYTREKRYNSKLAKRRLSK